MWSRGCSIEQQVQARLRRLTEQWSPTPLLDPPTAVGATAPDAATAVDERTPGVRWSYGRRALRGLAALLLLLAVVAGWAWWQAQPRAVTSTASVVDGAGTVGAVTAGEVASDDAPLPMAASEVVVHVVGSVRTPGLVRLPSGSRVAAAIDAAGGATDSEALATVNLARVVVDGEQIAVGLQSNATPGMSLNQATAAELEELPGVGPVLAGRIVAWRGAHGPFHSIDELDEVPGIGASLMEQIRPQVRV